MNTGSLIGNRYLIQRLLGQGGFGRTYLAYDTQRFGEACVLKEFLANNIEEEIARKSKELFEREARVLHNIDNPQIPKFIAWFTDQGKLFIVQEYIEGKTYSQVLRERLSQTGKPFSEAEVIQWLWDMLPILDYIHKRNLIHRDISLDNIILRTSQSKPVLIDFGLVKEKVSRIWPANNADNPSMGTVVGKMGYSPIEQIRSGVCFPCSDIYALGVCAVMLMTGKTISELLDHISQWLWLSYIKVSDNLNRILNKMLAEKPAERYQSVSEVLNELDLPTSSRPISAINSTLRIQINIDQTKREREVAEVLGSDEFRLLEQRVNKVHDRKQAAANSSLKFQQPENKTTNQTLLSNPYLTETSSKKSKSESFKPEFINYCQRELNNVVGSSANSIIKDVLAQNPNIKQEEFLEALAAGISNPQQSQSFTQRVSSVKKSQSGIYSEQPTKLIPTSNTKFIGNSKYLIGIGILFAIISGIWLLFMLFTKEIQPKVNLVCSEVPPPENNTNDKTSKKSRDTENGGYILFYGFEGGEIKDGKFNGCANYKNGKGEIYVGQFVDSAFNGVGKYYFDSGNKYIGTFENNKLNGQGTCFYKDDSPKARQGIWQNGKLKQDGETYTCN